jgi:hypothetical protein
VHTCIYITSALLFFSSFYIFRSSWQAGWPLPISSDTVCFNISFGEEYVKLEFFVFLQKRAFSTDMFLLQNMLIFYHSNFNFTDKKLFITFKHNYCNCRASSIKDLLKPELSTSPMRRNIYERKCVSSGEHRLYVVNSKSNWKT